MCSLRRRDGYVRKRKKPLIPLQNKRLSSNGRYVVFTRLVGAPISFKISSSTQSVYLPCRIREFFSRIRLCKITLLSVSFKYRYLFCFMLSASLYLHYIWKKGEEQRCKPGLCYTFMYLAFNIYPVFFQTSNNTRIFLPTRYFDATFPPGIGSLRYTYIPCDCCLRQF